MERNYIAFISYRHLPLEMETAKKLHRRIERYIIPKDLRKNGEKHLGLVFRDQEELPISSNLSSNIELALDRSKYLIVVCTPATLESKWVLREISYFIETHDREHVLAILADGTPETAFPPQLTEVRDETGALTGSIEPLAANIIAPTAAKRNRLFRTESLRLLAVLVGCPYDALFQRALRYRRRRAGIAAGLCAAVAGAFIAMLLNRNAQIQAQLEQTQINESRTLAALSDTAFREGDINTALNSALDALPGEDSQRPYVPEAEYALSRQLNLYRTGEMAYTRSFRQDTDITALVMDAAGSALATADDYGTLRCWDSAAGTLLWQRQFRVVAPLCFVEGKGVLCFTEEGTVLCGMTEGETLWQRSDLGLLRLCAISRDNRLGLWYANGQGGQDNAGVIDLTTGEDLGHLSLEADGSRYPDMGLLSSDGQEAVLLLRDDQAKESRLLYCDLAAGSAVTLEDALPDSIGAQAFRSAFAADGGILAACDDHDGTSWVRCWDKAGTLRFQTPIDTEKVNLSSDKASDQLAGVALLDSAGDYLVVGVKHDLYMLCVSTGEILWHRELPGSLLCARMFDNACLWLVLDDGTVTFCSESGLLTSDMGISSFRSGFDLAHGAMGELSAANPRVALVPESAPQRVSLVEAVENEGMFQVGAFSGIVNHTSMISSPTGNLVFSLCQYPAGKAAEGIFMDAAAGSTEDNLPLNGEEDLSDPGRLALTESGLLLTPGSIVNARTGARQPLPGGEAGNALHAIAPDGTIRTAAVEQGRTLHLLTDGTETAALPCPEGSWTPVCVGGNGYTLLRETGGAWAICDPDGAWTTPELGPGEQMVFALGSAGPLLACWDGEGLTVRNLADGTAIESRDLPPTTDRLLFADDDALLLACSETGALVIVDTATGETLHRSEHAGENIHFAADRASCRVYSAVNEDRLLLCYDDLTRPGPVLLVIDRGAWACVGVFDDVAAYLPVRNSVLSARILDGIYLSALYSREEIIALARERAAVPEEAAP